MGVQLYYMMTQKQKNVEKDQGVTTDERVVTNRQYVKYTPWIVGVVIWMIVAFLRPEQFLTISLAPIAFLAVVYIHQKIRTDQN